jgi:hypothetical protein
VCRVLSKLHAGRIRAERKIALEVEADPKVAVQREIGRASCRERVFFDV